MAVVLRSLLLPESFRSSPLRRFSSRSSLMSAAHPFLPVAIVGGGPAGLTAARILQLHKVPCRVYENESAATARNQGGSLDLHEDNGLWALRQCGLLEQFTKLSRPEGDCIAIMNKTAKVLYREEPPKAQPEAADERAVAIRGRPEIDRLQLRNLLLDSLEPGTVQWGHALSTLQPVPPTGSSPGEEVSQWELKFKNGATERAAVVIGADGAWSRVRPVLSSAKPSYTGVTFLDCTIPHVAARHPHLAAMVGPGSTFVLDDQRAIIAQMNGNDTLRTYACLKVSEDWLDSSDDSGGAFLHHVTADALETFIARYFSDWHESTLDFMRKAELDSVMVRRIYALPFDHSFSHSAHSRLVTAVGDAAHVMGPNGEGVNMAMLDAAQLCLALSKLLSPHSQPAARDSSTSSLGEQLAAAVLESERSMFERTKAQADDPINFHFFLSEDAANKFVALFKRMTAAPQEGHEGQQSSSSATSTVAADIMHNPTMPG